MHTIDDSQGQRFAGVQNGKIFATLSRREREVVELVCKGKTNKEVGSLLFVTEKTIKFHVGRIFKKAGVTNRFQLMIVMAERVQP